MKRPSHRPSWRCPTDPLLTAHISAPRRSLATHLRSKGADIHPPLGSREEQSGKEEDWGVRLPFLVSRFSNHWRGGRLKCKSGTQQSRDGELERGKSSTPSSGSERSRSPRAPPGERVAHAVPIPPGRGASQSEAITLPVLKVMLLFRRGRKLGGQWGRGDVALKGTASSVCK